MQKKYEKLIRNSAWHYPAAGTCWQDGMFLGNGDVGTLAYAPQHLEWIFNKVDIFDPTVEEAMASKITPHAEVMEKIAGKKHKNSMFLKELEAAPCKRPAIRNTLSAAKMRLRFWPGLGWAAPPAPQVEQKLSLYDGVLEEKLSMHNFHVHTEMFTPRDHEGFALRIKNDSLRMQMFVLELIRPSTDILPPVKWQFSDGNTYCFTQLLPGRKYAYAAAVKIVSSGKGSVAGAKNISENALSLSGSGNVDIFVAFKSSFSGDDVTNSAINECETLAKTGYDTLKSQHIAWWHNYWDNAYADFGKYDDIQKYFTYALYETASCYGKTPMPGLNGLFYGPVNEENPGVTFQAYTHDQNVQIPAMAFFPTNRTNFVEVIADTYLKNLKTLKKHTRKIFNAPGICLPLQMNQLGREYPVRHYRYSLCGSAYSGMILAWAWKYSKDVELLQNKLYPLLREFALFYTAMMSKDEKGVYHLDWSVPPEIFTFTRDEAATVSMLKVVLEVLVETSLLLNKDSRNRQLWKDILAHYPAVPMTPDGALWAGKDIPFDHYFYGGHILYAYFPAGIIDDPETARKTLELIEYKSLERSFADRKNLWHPNHEWSMFLQTATRLFMGDASGGWKGINRFLELFGKENGLFSHDPILIMPPEESEKNEQAFLKKSKNNTRWIDGTALRDDNPDLPYAIAVTANKNAKRLAPGVLEGASAFLFLASTALLQSRNGIIRIFPGVPEDFTGSFAGMLAENNIKVSAKMVKGKVKEIKLYSQAGGSCRMQYPRTQDLQIIDLKPGKTVKLQG